VSQCSQRVRRLRWAQDRPLTGKSVRWSIFFRAPSDLRISVSEVGLWAACGLRLAACGGLSSRSRNSPSSDWSADI